MAFDKVGSSAFSYDRLLDDGFLFSEQLHSAQSLVNLNDSAHIRENLT